LTTESKPKQGLFSQNNPQLYFHKSPAKGKELPNLSFSREMKNGLGQSILSGTGNISHDSKIGGGMTSDEMKHKLYVQPLMRFFHDCIDFERTMEINK
jgi:hypothetical protein